MSALNLAPKFSDDDVASRFLKTSVTQSKVDRTSVFQCSESGEKSNAFVQISLLSLAAQLAQFGSRPPIISMLTGIKDSIARKLYKDATGNTPPKGQLPSDPTYYTGDVHRHIESIWLLQSYKSMMLPDESSIGSVECHILTYKLYKQEFQIPTITFDRFFLLIRFALYGKHIKTEKCAQCDGPYLALANLAYRYDFICPVCEHNKLQGKQSKNK